MNTLVFVFGLLFPALAQAQTQPAACGLVGGCSAWDPIPVVVPPVLNLLIYVATALTILFVVWGGAQMLISFGDDSKVGNGKQSIILALIGFGIMLASQTIVGFVVQRTYGIRDAGGNPILATIDGALNAMLSLFTIVFIGIVIAAGFRLVISKGSNEESEAARKTMIWACIGAVMIHIAKALVSAVLNLGL